MEGFIMKGEWFLPSKKEVRVHGTLTFDPHEGTELELYDSFGNEKLLPEFMDQEIILGLTSESKQVTLYKCMMTRSGAATLVQGQESGKSSVSYSPLFCLVGCHADNKDELRFEKISSEIYNLDEWLRVSGFIRSNEEFELAKTYEAKIHYKLPDQIIFPLTEGLQGKFNFTASQPGLYFFQKQATIKQRVEFEITLNEEKDFEELLEHIFTFLNFLVLALYEGTYPVSVTLSGNRHVKFFKESTERKNIQLHFSRRKAKLKQRPKSAREMLFSYHQLKDRFPSIIKSWFEKYELLEPAFDLVFEQFYSENRFSVNAFLNLAQSAETFHARVHNHTRMPKEEYKAMEKDILTMTLGKYNDWLKDQFSWGNSLRLHTRLTELTEKYANPILDRILGEKEKFVLDVKRSRNYYTHYSNDGKKHALKGSDLFYLSERMKILLVCGFLMEIGLTKEELSKSMNDLKWKLFSHLANWKEPKETDSK